MPTGKVKWYDSEKGFGFLSRDEGEDVYVRSDALPARRHVAQGRRPRRVRHRPGQPRRPGAAGAAARPGHVGLAVAGAARRKDPEAMAVIVEDLIRMLDAVGEGYRHGRHPDAKKAKPIAQVLRAVAAELEL